MPKSKRLRSKPDLVGRLCDAIKHLTAERARAAGDRLYDSFPAHRDKAHIMRLFGLYRLP
jgi:hypothetical protein